MYMASLHNNHFRKNTNWLPTIYKTKTHKQICRNKLRFKGMPVWRTPKGKGLSFAKAGVCGSGHYQWNTKNHQLMMYHQKNGFRYFMQNKYTIYNKLRKDGRHNFHRWNWMDFYSHTHPIIAHADSLDFKYDKINNKYKYNNRLRCYV